MELGSSFGLAADLWRIKAYPLRSEATCPGF
jgi:hypothetical protein